MLSFLKALLVLTTGSGLLVRAAPVPLIKVARQPADGEPVAHYNDNYKRTFFNISSDPSPINGSVPSFGKGVSKELLNFDPSHFRRDAGTSGNAEAASADPIGLYNDAELYGDFKRDLGASRTRSSAREEVVGDDLEPPFFDPDLIKKSELLPGNESVADTNQTDFDSSDFKRDDTVNIPPGFNVSFGTEKELLNYDSSDF